MKKYNKEHEYVNTADTTLNLSPKSMIEKGNDASKSTKIFRHILSEVPSIETVSNFEANFWNRKIYSQKLNWNP